MCEYGSALKFEIMILLLNAQHFQDEIGDYSCSCETGWSGRNCDDNINDCTPTSCMNGGTCNVRGEKMSELRSFFIIMHTGR